MDKVTIFSANTGSKLSFFDVKNDYLTVEFSSASLYALHRIWLYTEDGNRLVNLFKEMAQNWKGWEGEKTWDAIEGDFNLCCTSDKLGHITLAVKLAERHSSEWWSVECQINIEAGQLDRIAKEMIVLFGKS